VKRRVSFRPEAQAEALETKDWYETRRPGLGAEFGSALEQTIERIAENPMQFRSVRGETRRATPPDAQSLNLGLSATAG
jgi:hypothetical protein